MSVALLERSVVSSPSEISIDMRNMSTLANPAAAATRTSTPDRKSLQRIAAEALHTKSVTIDRIPGTLFRNYKLQPSSHSAAATTTTEETFYILKCRPSSPAIRLLRHEEDRLRTEAYTLQTLLLHSSSSSTKSSEMPSTKLIPRLIASSPHHHHHRTNPKTPLDPSPYILTGPFHGHLLSEISPQLSQTPSEKIQQRIGFFYRNLTTSFSPCFSSSSTQQTKPFGPLYPSSDSSSDSTSFTTWSQFYTTLLETLLLDAEDALINLPYAFIRETVRRNRNSLDQITKPKLVFLEGLVDEKNILVRRRRLESSGAGERRESGDEWEISGILDWSGVVWGDEWMSDGFYDHFSKGRSMGGFLEGFWGGRGRQNQRRSGEEVVRQYLYVFSFYFFLFLFPFHFLLSVYLFIHRWYLHLVWFHQPEQSFFLIILILIPTLTSQQIHPLPLPPRHHPTMLSPFFFFFFPLLQQLQQHQQRRIPTNRTRRKTKSNKCSNAIEQNL